MAVSTLALIAILALPGAQQAPSDAGRPGVVSVGLGSDTVTFRLTQRVVTDIDLHVRGADYTVPLACAGGLRDVRFDTAALHGSGGDRARAEGTFALFFDMGTDPDRRFGTLPRVQLSFYRGRLTEMWVTTMTGEHAAFSAKLCVAVPVGPITCKDTRQLQGLTPDVLVQQLRDLPAPLPAFGRPTETEMRRRNIYEELLDWGTRSVPALAAGLRDPDRSLRKNAALAFEVLSGGWWPFECGQATLDLRSALPDLVRAFDDVDPDVRSWSAQAVGSMGANADEAVPPLVGLLERDDAGARASACMALGRMGAAARSALPSLRRALSDANANVRRLAARAIARIEQP